MNREIKFRGQRTDNKQWVSGYYFKTPLTDGTTGSKPEDGWFFLTGRERHCIAQNGCVYEVIPETVGQYTGEVIPGCGEMIYQDDIVEQSYINKLNNKRVIKRYLIDFEKGHYVAKCIGHSPYGDTLLHFMLANYKYLDTKIVGNKHDKPELLEAEDE